MKYSLLTSLFLLVGATALAQTDAADYFDGQPWGWACCANQQGSAYPLDGGMRAAQPTTIVLTSNGADNANAIMSAIAQYDIIVLDGSAGDFVIGSQMTIANAQHKTIVGRNHAVLATQFYLTDADVAYLKAQGLEGLSSTDQMTGTLPDGTQVTCDRRAFYTKKAMMELQYQKTGSYSLPNKAGIFRFEATCENIVVRNLTLQGPGAVDIDGADLLYDAYATHLWVDHCTFIDSQAGALDTRGDYNTYTWNHFYYTQRSYSHAYTCGLGWVSNHSTVLHVTWGYNLWGTGCQRRLPQADDAYLHLMNNYHNCPGNAIGMTLNAYTTALVEGNFAAQGVKDPLTGSGANRRILARGNNFSYTSTATDVTLPYSYPEPVNCYSVPALITAPHGAGATIDDEFMPLGYNELNENTFGFWQTEFETPAYTDIQLPVRNLCGASYKLSSNNPGVVAISSKTGKIRASDPGVAIVTCRVQDALYGEYETTIRVTVNQPVTYQSLRKWNFTFISPDTWSNMAADAAHWTPDGSTFINKGALSRSALRANGVEVAETEGLTFTVPDGKLVVYNDRLRLNKAGSVIYLPALQKGDKVRVTWKSANASDQRGFTTQNLSVGSFLTDGTQATKEALVVADGVVSLTVTNGIYVSSIEVLRQEGGSAISVLGIDHEEVDSQSFTIDGRPLRDNSRPGLQVRQGRIVWNKRFSGH